MELFEGEVWFKLYTAVETLENDRATKNLAHDGLSNELLNELKYLLEAKGYYVQELAADLNPIGEADHNHVKIIQKATDRAKYEDKIIRGKTKVVRIEI